MRRAFRPLLLPFPAGWAKEVGECASIPETCARCWGCAARSSPAEPVLERGVPVSVSIVCLLGPPLRYRVRLGRDGGALWSRLSVDSAFALAGGCWPLGWMWLGLPRRCGQPGTCRDVMKNPPHPTGNPSLPPG